MNIEDKEKIIKLLKLMSSDNDNEALLAIRTVNKIIKSRNLIWEDIFDKEVIFKTKEIFADRPYEYFEMPFGKYKGMSLSSIYEEDPRYLEWASENLEGLVGNHVRNYVESF